MLLFSEIDVVPALLLPPVTAVARLLLLANDASGTSPILSMVDDDEEDELLFGESGKVDEEPNSVGHFPSREFRRRRPSAVIGVPSRPVKII